MRPLSINTFSPSNMRNLVLVFALVFVCSCSTVKTIPVETIREVTKTDTVYLNKLEYDSIYINHDHLQEYHLNPLNHFSPAETDTVFVKDVSVEYRYKLLRDTIFKAKVEHIRDSIPYQVTVTKVEQVRYVPPWIKYLAIAGAASLLLLVIGLLRKFKVI